MEKEIKKVNVEAGRNSETVTLQGGSQAFIYNELSQMLEPTEVVADKLLLEQKNTYVAHYGVTNDGQPAIAMDAITPDGPIALDQTGIDYVFRDIRDAHRGTQTSVQEELGAPTVYTIKEGEYSKQGSRKSVVDTKRPLDLGVLEEKYGMITDNNISEVVEAFIYNNEVVDKPPVPEVSENEITQAESGGVRSIIDHVVIKLGWVGKWSGHSNGHDADFAPGFVPSEIEPLVLPVIRAVMTEPKPVLKKREKRVDTHVVEERPSNQFPVPTKEELDEIRGNTDEINYDWIPKPKDELDIIYKD